MWYCRRVQKITREKSTIPKSLLSPTETKTTKILVEEHFLKFGLLPLFKNYFELYFRFTAGNCYVPDPLDATTNVRESTEGSKFLDKNFLGNENFEEP